MNRQTRQASHGTRFDWRNYRVELTADTTSDEFEASLRASVGTSTHPVSDGDYESDSAIELILMDPDESRYPFYRSPAHREQIFVSAHRLRDSWRGHEFTTLHFVDRKFCCFSHSGDFSNSKTILGHR